MNFVVHMNELEPSDAAAFKGLASRLRSMSEREPSPSLEGRIMAAVEEERQRERRRFRVPGSWRGAAAAAALIAAGLYFYSGVERRHERAVADTQAGVGWLAANQEADGTWSPASTAAPRAIAPRSPRFRRWPSTERQTAIRSR